MQLECKECHRVLNLPDSKLPVGKPFSFTCPYCKYKNLGYIDSPAEQTSPPTGQTQLPTGEGFREAQEKAESWDQPTRIYAPNPAPPTTGDWNSQDMAIDSQALEAAQQWAEQSAAGGDQSVVPPVTQLGNPGLSSPTPAPVQADDPQPRKNVTPDMTRPRSEVIDEATMHAIMNGAVDERPRALVVYDDDEMADMLVSKLEAIGHHAEVAVTLRDAAKQLKFADFSILLIQEDYYGATLSSNHLIKAVQNLDNINRRGMLVAIISPTMVTLDDLLAFSLSIDAVVNKAELESVDRILMSIIARHKKFYSAHKEVLGELGIS